jgi:MmgE/PrpD N-terminal domain
MAAEHTRSWTAGGPTHLTQSHCRPRLLITGDQPVVIPGVRGYRGALTQSMLRERSSVGEGQRLTTRLAEFAANYRYEALPTAVVERAREIVLDTIGSILLGVGPEYSSVRRLVDLAREFGGPSQCTLIGHARGVTS